MWLDTVDSTPGTVTQVRASAQELIRFAKDRGTALVLVTHHVEEITPAFSHALLLRAGQVHRSGELHRVLTSENLATVFGAPLKLRRGKGRLRLEHPRG